MLVHSDATRQLIDTWYMEAFSLLSDDFARAAAMAGLRARREALEAGHPVVFLHGSGRYVQEQPDGRLFEVRFEPEKTGEQHVTVLGELEP